MKTRFSPMKTNSYRRNSLWSPTRTALLGALLLIVGVFGIDLLLGGILRLQTQAVASVAWTAAVKVTVTDVDSVFASKKALIAQNEALEGLLLVRDEEHARYAGIVAENTLLREMARVATSGPGVTARIISPFRSSPYGTFMIAAGSADGVREGSFVLTPGGFVFGKVTTVDSERATVQSLFSPGIATDFVSGQFVFTAQGRGGGNTRAEVSRDALVRVGDSVIAPGYGGNPAGIIGSIESASSSATKILHIRIPINLNTLQFVYVVSR